MPRAKRRKPHNPAKAHDRRSRDLLRNAEVVTVEVDNPLALEPGEKIVALNRLQLSVPEGGVFGFLGPNGSGKTTTIRCLLGLVRPSGGRCRILGADSQRDLHTVIGRIGGNMTDAPTPSRCIAARCSPRAIRLTSAPPRASAAPT